MTLLARWESGLCKMAGSKKGERRGGAKSGMRGKGTPTGGRGAGTPNKIKIDLTPQEPSTVRGKGRLTEEREAYMHTLITGTSSRNTSMLPKEVMFEAMHYFLDLARTYGDLVKANAKLVPEDEQQRAQLDLLIQRYQNETDKYFIMAADVAFKAAPFYHAKLAAVAMLGANDPNKQDTITDILRQIDRESRAKTIEHRSSERLDS